MSLSLSKNILSYGTRRIITVFTKAHHRTLSRASRIQFAQSIPSSLRSILMLSSHVRLGLASGLLPSDHNFYASPNIMSAIKLSRTIRAGVRADVGNTQNFSLKIERNRPFGIRKHKGKVVPVLN
jgi:hypothetical protein